MFSKVLLCCLVAYVAAGVAVEEPQLPPHPYSFSVDNTDEFGTHIAQEETGDENNNKVGSYSYTDANGLTRTVKYVADAEGFKVTIETNEPGTKTSNPADAQYISSSVEGPAPVVVKAAPAPVKVVVQKPAVLHAQVAHPVVQVAAHPVAVHAVHAVPYAVHHAASPVVFATAHHPVALNLAKSA